MYNKYVIVIPKNKSINKIAVQYRTRVFPKLLTNFLLRQKHRKELLKYASSHAITIANVDVIIYGCFYDIMLYSGP